jgi:hypothetical protein
MRRSSQWDGYHAFRSPYFLKFKLEKRKDVQKDKMPRNGFKMQLNVAAWQRGSAEVI